MSRYLFTSEWSDDLGLLARAIPMALELERRGHEVAFCNPAQAPQELIRKAGLRNLPPDLSGFPDDIEPPGRGTPEIWDMDHFASLTGFFDERLIRTYVEVHLALIEEYAPDVVVDAVDLSACIAARVAGKPLASVIQADMHPASPGFIWWRPKPDDVPSVVGVINGVLASYGLEPIASASELLVGDLTLVAGTPETDPLPEGTEALHIGPMFGHDFEAELPADLEDFAGDEPLVWLYCGSLRYPLCPWADSFVVLQAAIEGLADRPLRVVATAGHQVWPEDISLPENFRRYEFLPGLSLARRCDLMIHHGGHGSCLTGAVTGTPALIVPTFTERESTARRMVALGVAEMLLPKEDAAGEKRLSGELIGRQVETLLADRSYAESARRLAERMRDFDRLETVADALEGMA